MPSGMIRINYQGMIDNSKNFKTKADEIERIKTELMAECKKLDENWDGASQDNFISEFDGAGVKSLQNLNGMLVKLSTYIKEVADKFKEADDNTKISISE